jgi:hypothetical protein
MLCSRLRSRSCRGFGGTTRGRRWRGGWKVWRSAIRFPGGLGIGDWAGFWGRRQGGNPESEQGCWVKISPGCGAKVGLRRGRRFYFERRSIFGERDASIWISFRAGSVVHIPVFSLLLECWGPDDIPRTGTPPEDLHPHHPGGASSPSCRRGRWPRRCPLQTSFLVVVISYFYRRSGRGKYFREAKANHFGN